MSETIPPAAERVAATRRSPLVLSAVLGAMGGALITGTAWWATTMNTAEGPSGPPFEASGTVTVFGSWVHGQAGEGCVGTGDFADLRGGTPVQIVAPSGHKLALGSLTKGRPGEVAGDSCSWSVSITGVPGGAAQYQILVGDRDPVLKEAGELQSGFKLSYGKQS
ncbi:hypothetical protein [Streptomyces sp. NPDC059994]|uniref:hypothetical protein n=1 Tax=Streptomyces sp. NPDC059994 TaxID=3347029 RepID=UPI0036C88C0D